MKKKIHPQKLNTDLQKKKKEKIPKATSKKTEIHQITHEADTKKNRHLPRPLCLNYVERDGGGAK